MWTIPVMNGVVKGAFQQCIQFQARTKRKNKSTNNTTMEQIFQITKDHFEELERVKDQIQTTIKRLDEPISNLQGLFQKIHQNKPNFRDHIKELCSQAEPIIEKCAEVLKQLASSIPTGGYWKYYNMWQSRLSNIVSMIAMRHFLLKDMENDLDNSLITKRDTEKMLGIDQLENFYLPLEDYL